MAPPTSGSILTQVFGKDPRQAILAWDDAAPLARKFKRGQDGLLFPESFPAHLTAQNFSGLSGAFHLFGDSAEVTMKVWFRISGDGDKRVVDVQRADMTFTKPWGGTYFFYCKDATPATYHLKPMPSVAELKAEGGWCKRQEQEGETCKKHKCCETDAQSDYFEYVSPSKENWDCNGVKFLEIDHLNITAIEQDGDEVERLGHTTIYAHTKLRVNPKSPWIPRLSPDNKKKDISKLFYGAFFFAGTHGYFKRHNRDGQDVTAVVESFFLSFAKAAP